MKYKFCQHCGKKIPVNAMYCQYCGGRQYNVDQSSNHGTLNDDHKNDNHFVNQSKNQVDPKLRSKDKSYPQLDNSNYDKASLTHTDWGMLGVNAVSCLMQLLLSLQTMLMPLSKASGEVDLTLIVLVIGIIISGIDGWECYKNRLPLTVPILGIIGNIIGIALSAITNTDVMLIVGAIILGISFYIIHQQLFKVYR